MVISQPRFPLIYWKIWRGFQNYSDLCSAYRLAVLYGFESIRDQFWTARTSRSFNDIFGGEPWKHGCISFSTSDVKEAPQKCHPVPKPISNCTATLKNDPLACINNFSRSQQTTKSLKLRQLWSLLRLDFAVLHLVCCTTTTGHNFLDRDVWVARTVPSTRKNVVVVVVRPSQVWRWLQWTKCIYDRCFSCIFVQIMTDIIGFCYGILCDVWICMMQPTTIIL